ncbi:MAG: NADH-quinone oxidoreductase subunit H [Bacteroidales bacterium]|nr:NADH-quinone oxidoreductase subunit H [Bacteroidales bacterium]
MIDFLSEYLPNGLAILLAALLAAAVIVGFMGVSALLLIWGERKISGRIQDRLGPTRVGPFGLLQSLADGIKLIAKEDTTPAAADATLFRLAPYLAFCATFIAFIALPAAPNVIAVDLSIGVFFVLAVLSSEVFGVLLAGYASGSKWSIYGGLREAAQVVSYEVPRSLCVLVPVVLAGTLNLTAMSQQQIGYFWNWNLFHDPFTFVAFFIFFTTATASCKRAPFDLAEAESELVAGFHTEYSGIRWSYFFMAEYGSMFAVSGLAAILFLGGWHTGFLPFEPVERWGLWMGSLFDVLVFIGKGYLLVFVMMWMRWTLPRLRIDQVMMTCLKYFLPISCVLLLGVCLWQLLVSPRVGEAVRYILAGSVTLGGIVVGLQLLRPIPNTAPAGELPGVWARPTSKL